MYALLRSPSPSRCWFEMTEATSKVPPRVPASKEGLRKLPCSSIAQGEVKEFTSYPMRSAMQATSWDVITKNMSETRTVFLPIAPGKPSSFETDFPTW